MGMGQMKRIQLGDLADMISNGNLSHLTKYCGCCQKILYSSELVAKEEAAVIRAKGKDKSRAYECPKSNGWHLTSQLYRPSAKTKRKPKSSKSHRTNRPDV